MKHKQGCGRRWRSGLALWLEQLEPRQLLSTVFFMHQSVGQGILDDQGAHQGLRGQLEGAGHQVADYSLYDTPPGSSLPTDIATLFADTNHDGHYGDALDNTPALAGAVTADVLMFKSCFTAIDYLPDDEGAATLAAWKQAYIENVAPYANQHPQQRLVPMPAPPVRDGRPGITPEANARARDWANWLQGTFIAQYCTSGNVFSFDLFDTLADPPGDATNPNMLREEYRQPIGDPQDPECHPNETGYAAAADALFAFLQNTVLPAGGLNLYVSTGGDDGNDGSFTHPFRHVQHALDVAQPGQHVFVRGGTYNEYLVFGTSGTPGNPITLQGYGTEQVILSGTGLNWANGILLGNTHDITIQDLVISNYIADGTRGYGIGGEGGNDNLTIRDLDISLVGEVIKLQESSLAISHNVLIENVVGHTYDAAGFNIGPVGSVDGVTIRNCTLTGPGGGDDTAIDGIAVENGQNITIENCTVTGHPGDGIDLKADNVAVRRVTVTGQSRNGIKLWGANTVLENSIAVNNGLTSLVLAGGGPYTLTANLVGNTTLYDYSIVYGDAGAPSQVIANDNIFLSTAGQTGTLIYASPGTTFQGDYNIYYAPNRTDAVIDWDTHAAYSADEINDGTWAAASGADAHSLHTNPALGGDLHPLAGSPAIDGAPSGPAVDRNGIARPIGGGFDIGPFEVGGGGGPDIVPPTATLDAPDRTQPGTTPYDFTVTYSDNDAVNIATLGDGDLLIAGPGGSFPTVHFLGVDTPGDGTPRIATYRVDAPGGAWNDADNGVYNVSILAGQVADVTGNPVPAGLLGTFNVNIASDSLGFFGTVGGQTGVRLTLSDADGTNATFGLSGPGTGEVFSTDDGWDVNLTGTTTGSGASFSAKRSRTPGDDGKGALGNVHIVGSLKSLAASLMDLHGTLDVTGFATSITLADVMPGARIDILANGATSLPGVAPLAITLGRVNGAVLNTTAIPIKSLTVIDWLDGDPADDILAPWIGSLTTRGRKANAKAGLVGVAGDFQAEVVLNAWPQTGQAPPGAPLLPLLAPALAKMSVVGWLRDSRILAMGDIAAVALGGIWNSGIYAGTNDPSLTGLPTAGAVGLFQPAAIRAVSVSGKVRDANGRSTLDANLAAQTLGRVKFCYPDWVNGGVPWGLAGGAPASLTCTDVNGRYTWALTWPAVPGSSFEVR